MMKKKTKKKKLIHIFKSSNHGDANMKEHKLHNHIYHAHY